MGELPIEYAREQVWGYLARELNLDGSLTAVIGFLNHGSGL